MSTLMLFDFDGVLNPIPYRREWIGPQDAGINSLEFNKGSNWQTVELEIDNAIYFKPDRAETVLVPSYLGDPREIHIRWSTELMDKINALVASEDVEFRWLTSWREHAPTILAPVLGLDPSWKSIRWAEKMSDYTQGFKLVAIEDLIREEGERRAIVWVDDVATDNAKMYPEYGDYDHERFGDQVLSPFKTNDIATLFLAPSTEYGISREQWAQIENFVRAHS